MRQPALCLQTNSTAPGTRREWSFCDPEIGCYRRSRLDAIEDVQAVVTTAEVDHSLGNGGVPRTTLKPPFDTIVPRLERQRHWCFAESAGREESCHSHLEPAEAQYQRSV
jgi:hypothetical protein